MVDTKVYKLQYIPSVDNLADFFMNKQRHDYLVSYIVQREKMHIMKITKNKGVLKDPE